MINLSTSKKSNQSFADDSFGSEISSELQHVLQHIVDDAVERMGCVGAFVATLEADNSLPLRAYNIKIPPSLVKQFEAKVGVMLTSPKAVTHLDKKKFKDNLSVRAIKGKKDVPETYLVSDQLYDLFRPLTSKMFSQTIQHMTGIKQVISLPFLLKGEVVGNLFAASTQQFSERDIAFLLAFCDQAAIAIQSQRYLEETQALERVTLALQSSITDETQILQTVVDTVVFRLGYMGAMVATLESNNSLPVRAYQFSIASNLIKQWENLVGLSLIGPRAVTFLDDERYKDNLSVRAVRGKDGKPEEFVTSSNLYDLFRPIVNRPLCDMLQKMTGIKQVIAVPFFIEDEVVGNLFISSRRERFTNRETHLLTALAQQAAVGLRNARLYLKAEERRQIAQTFARMAFTASTNVHALRNHIGAFHTYLSLLRMLPYAKAKEREEILETGASIRVKLGEAKEILDSLNQPWRKISVVQTDINACLMRALQKNYMEVSIDASQTRIEVDDGVVFHTTLANDLPSIQSSPDMLTEAFKVIVKNSLEAIKEKEKDKFMWIDSSLKNDNIIMVNIRDSGTGIKKENFNKIFELGWSSKKGMGMGFGLFWTKDFIEGLGGTIALESVWQKGTTFHITIPLHKNH